MELAYLLFDFSDEEGGDASFDALASVPPQRLPALLAEVEAVLAWAIRSFGPPAAGDPDGTWDYALHATDADDAPLSIHFDADSRRVALQAGCGDRVTLALTVSGTRAFAEALRDTFSEAQ